MVSAQTLERRISDSGRRLTEPRRQLIKAMRNLGDHFTADQVVQAAPRVGRATVFRTMRLLQEVGVALPGGAGRRRRRLPPHRQPRVTTTT